MPKDLVSAWKRLRNCWYFGINERHRYDIGQLLSYKRLDQALEIDTETETRLKEIYKELYLAAQVTMEALLEDNTQKAQQVIDAKAHYNGLIERARSYLYFQIKSEREEELSLYKLETSTLENYRRIHNLLRRICLLVTKDREISSPQNETLQMNT